MNIATLSPKQIQSRIADAEHDKKQLLQKIKNSKGLQCNMYRAQFSNRESIIKRLKQEQAARSSTSKTLFDE